MRAPDRSSALAAVLIAAAAIAAPEPAEAQADAIEATARAKPRISTTPTEQSVNAFDAILHDYVDDRGGVDYARLQKNRAGLDAYIAALAGLDPAAIADWPATQRIAFWINSYNAITLQRIIDHYPIKRGGIITGLRFPENSIRQIAGVWDTLKTRVAGHDITLDHIEHEILRKEFREPRIHTALVCASKSCPPLRAEAFNAETLNAQLDDQSRRFLHAASRFNIDREKKLVRLSPILKWYAEDFVGVYNAAGAFAGRPPALGAVLDFASRYAGREDTDFLRTQPYRVEYLEYDWSLNERN